MTAPLKLLHVYQNSRVGGVQQQILGLIRNYDRTVVSPSFCSLGPLGEIGREIERLGVPVYSMEMADGTRFSPALVLKLRTLMRRQAIDVVRTHKYRSNLLGVTAARLAGVPVVIASQHSDYRKDLKPARTALNRLVLPRADRVVAVAAGMRDDLVRFGRLDPARVLLMPNGVDTEAFSPDSPHPAARRAFGIGADDRVVGFVGRLATIKGVSHLLEAARQLLPARPVNVLLIGGGPQRGDFESRARALGIADRVIFTGERRDIAAALSVMDVFCLPSLSEGLPNALLEAMAAGRPVVATAVGGIPGVVRDGDTGLLVEPNDAGALAAGIRRVIDDRELAQRLGRQARALVLETRSIRAAARAWESLYMEVAREKRAIEGVAP